MRITILDYGVGNLYSLRKALERRGAEARVSKMLPSEAESDGLILPGVGSFSAAAKKLAPVKPGLLDLAEGGRPILGVCLGMQLFLDRSEEGPGAGLGLMPGEVVRLPLGVKVPHIGWNQLVSERPSPLTDGVDEGAWAYFVHSYYPRPRDPEVVVTRASYGVEFPAVLASKNLFGTQFHPEKSSVAGARILQNFLSLCRR